MYNGVEVFSLDFCKWIIKDRVGCKIYYDFGFVRDGNFR